MVKQLFCVNYKIEKSMIIDNLITIVSFIMVAGPLAVGWALDFMFGDPERLPHPIVYYGKWIAFWEKRLNKGENRKAKGAVFAVLSIVLVFVLVRLLVYGLNTLMFVGVNLLPVSFEFSYIMFAMLYVFVAGIIIFFCLAGHTLRKEVRMVFEAVDRSVEEGRVQVARIVGRDTSELSANEIRTAALETLAENLSDGVIAPLFWLLFLGLPGMCAYKMINTLDSMIGYQNERYKDFGCWAAKIDDFANYVPARLTAFLILLYYSIMPNKRDYPASAKHSPSFKLKYGLSFIAHFGPQHASPNSGWPEAAVACILNCRFGGPHNYFGEYFYKPYIGTNQRELTTEDMRLSIAVCLGAEVLFGVFMFLYYSLNQLLQACNLFYWGG